MIKKIYDFACLCAYALGSIGGFGYCAYLKQWVIAVAVVALAAMAFGFVKARLTDIMN